MKKLIILLTSILATTQIFAMHEVRRSSQCCGLDNVVYTIGSWFGRNDYLYLAHANSIWFLKKKIALKEDLADLDRYYPRCETIINRTSVGIYCTPLHEAIERGNIECVKLLCAAGADKSKKIKISSELKNEEVAAESEFQRIVVVAYDVEPEQLENELKKVMSEDSVDLSAIDFAEKLIKNKRDDFISIKQRKAIYNLLKN